MRSKILIIAGALFLIAIASNEIFSLGLDLYKRIASIFIACASVVITVPILLYLNKIESALSLFLFQGGCTIFIFAEQYQESGLISSTTKEVVAISQPESLYFSTLTWLNQSQQLFIPPNDVLLFVAAQNILGYLYMAVLAFMTISYGFTISNSNKN